MSIPYVVPHFCDNNGIVASPQPEMLQRAFDILTGLFGQVVIHTNTRKVASMGFHPCHASGRMSVE